MVEVLTSTRNDRVRAVASLQRRKGRREQGLFLVEGQHPVAEALADGWVQEVFCLPDHEDQWSAAPRTTLVDERVLAHLSDATSPQGVVAVARQRTLGLEELDLGGGIVVVLCGVADPGNLGTIIRTADAVGARGVVLTRGSADPFNPKVVRSTAGSISHVPLVVDVEPGEALAALRAAGHRTVGLDGYATETIEQADLLDPPVALVMGSEAHGLPEDVRAGLDALAAIPVYGRAESLNLAVATAVTLYEAARRERREE